MTINEFNSLTDDDIIYIFEHFSLSTFDYFTLFYLYNIIKMELVGTLDNDDIGYLDTLEDSELRNTTIEYFESNSIIDINILEYFYKKMQYDLVLEKYDIGGNYIIIADDLIDKTFISPALNYDNESICDADIDNYSTIYNPITNKIEYIKNNLPKPDYEMKCNVFENNLRNVEGLINFGSFVPHEIRIGAFGQTFDTSIEYIQNENDGILTGTFTYNIQVPADYMSNTFIMKIDIIDVYLRTTTIEKVIYFNNSIIRIDEIQDIILNKPFYITGIIPEQYDGEGNLTNLNNLKIFFNNNEASIDFDVNVIIESGDYQKYKDNNESTGIYFYIEAILTNDVDIGISIGMTGTNYNRFICPNYFSLVSNNEDILYNMSNLKINLSVDSTFSTITNTLYGRSNPKVAKSWELNAILNKHDIIRQVQSEIISRSNSTSTKFHTDYNKNTEKSIFNQDSMSFEMKIIENGCRMHKPTRVSNIDEMNTIPETLENRVIYKEDINSLRSRITKILMLWCANDNLPLIELNGETIQSETIIEKNHFNDIIDTLKTVNTNLKNKLENVPNEVKLNNVESGEIITIDLYNSLINSYNSLSNACVCNSDCACNSNCICNTNYGRAKE